MNEYVKNSIEMRKNSIYNLYEIDDEKIKKNIEDLFKRIDEFGVSCSDAMDFEAKFATSPLNTEYINVFTELSSKCKMKPQEGLSEVMSDEDLDKERLKDELRYVADTTTQPFRAKANQAITKKMRSVPILGEAMQVSQTRSLFNKFKKDKNSGEDQVKDSEE